MPIITSANTNAAPLVIGEKEAALIRSEATTGRRRLPS